MARKKPTDEQVKKWQDSAGRMMQIWHAEALGTKEELYNAIGGKNLASISRDTFFQNMRENGRYSPRGTIIVELFCNLVAKRLHSRYRHWTLEQLEKELFRHIDAGATSPLQSVFAGAEDEQKPVPGQPCLTQTEEDEQRSVLQPKIDALIKSKVRDQQNFQKIRPKIRIAPRYQDDASTATLSLEPSGQENFNGITGELSQPLIAEVLLMPVRDNDGMICFEAITIQVTPNEIARADKAGVQVSFGRFGAAISDQQLFGCYEDKINEKVGQTAGVRTRPIWRLDKIPKVPEKGLRVYNIELGQISIKYSSEDADPQVECEFQALVDLNDLVWVSDSDGNFPPTQKEKGEAFDRVLANKQLKGDGRLALVSSSVVVIEPNGGGGSELLY
ncbi:hypothetical protein [Cereibacter johrii]|uniref:hypothetical protein n=1 Tax=Cereibacter johrii TaxID=445629 RepID=UPI003CF43627